MRDYHPTTAALHRARQWARIEECGAALILLASTVSVVYMAVVALAGG